VHIVRDSCHPLCCGYEDDGIDEPDPRSLAELRSQLLARRFAPGEKLKIDDLCRRFAVDSSAVREALSRLASEGFVVSEPQRGFRVAPLPEVE
jgi:DNA-binding GntR family transcriptional regulator